MRGHAFIKVISALCILISAFTLAEMIEAQPERPDLSITWAHAATKRELLKAFQDYSVGVRGPDSQGIIVAPPTPAPESVLNLPARGVVIGFIYTSGKFTPGSTYTLPAGAYSVVLRQTGSTYSVDFRSGERTITVKSIRVEEIPSPVQQPTADVTLGRPCYTIDSRRLCP